MKHEWQKVHTKSKAISQILDLAGVRRELVWRSEAEDHLVADILGLRDALNLDQLRTVSRILHWYRILLSGESRSSLQAKALGDGEPEGCDS